MFPLGDAPGRGLVIAKKLGALWEWATTTARFGRGARKASPAQLLAGAQAGSVAHFGELYRRYFSVVVEHLRPMAGADAEDIAQETFLRLQSKLESYQERGTFEAWLKGVAYNIYRTQRRSVDRRREEDLIDDRTGPLPDYGKTGPVTRDDFWTKAALHMPESLREVWGLHLQGFEAREIAEQLGLSANAVSTRLSRARDFLGREAKRLVE